MKQLIRFICQIMNNNAGINKINHAYGVRKLKQKVKKILTERSENKKSKSQSTIKYKIIEFNAWKYQDTPEIWAYLYETIYKQALNWFQQLLFNLFYLIKHQWIRIIFSIAIFILICILYNQISVLQGLSESVKTEWYFFRRKQYRT